MVIITNSPCPQVLSGENWNEILYNGMHATGSPVTSLYFVILVCIGSFIILNLTLAILLSNFDDGDYGENDMYTAEDLQDLANYLASYWGGFPVWLGGSGSRKVEPETELSTETEEGRRDVSGIGEIGEQGGLTLSGDLAACGPLGVDRPGTPPGWDLITIYGHITLDSPPSIRYTPRMGPRCMARPAPSRPARYVHAGTRGAR